MEYIWLTDQGGPLMPSLAATYVAALGVDRASYVQDIQSLLCPKGKSGPVGLTHVVLDVLLLAFSLFE